MTIVPLTYLGSTEWFTHLASACDGRGGGEDAGRGDCRGDFVIDIGEYPVKQTARNRCEIMTSGGVASLTVPVHGGAGSAGIIGVAGTGKAAKLRTRDVRIDNSKRWQHTHWVSMVSAYRNSPFFDHYEHLFAPVYEKKFDFLVDLNLELLNIVVSILWPGLPVGGAAAISENYVAAAPGDLDLRGKKALRRPDVAVCSDAKNLDYQEYTQVFSDRIPFVPGLSIADMLFCEGPSARELLRRQAIR